MDGTIKELADAQQISENVCRILHSFMQYPEFGIGGVPVQTAAKVFGKDATWVRQGIIDGWLDIGYAVPSETGNRTSFYISPKKLWEKTGYVWIGIALLDK